jgi:hypothetical protein
MLTFKEFIELKKEDVYENISFIMDSNKVICEGIISGIMPTSAKSKKHDWDKFYKNTDKVKLLYDNLGGSHYKLYVLIHTYFLTDNKDDYLGYIELKTTNNIARVQASSSELSGGFYKIMFPILLSLPNIDSIYSDNDLSTNAFSSYSRLKSDHLIISVYSPSENKELALTLDNYKAHPNNVIKVSEKFKGSIKEHFNKHFNRQLETIQENKLLNIPIYTGINKELDQQFFGDTFWEYIEHN